VKDVATIPTQFEKGNITVNAVKKYFPLTEHAGEVISEQLPQLESHKPANYFVEVQD